MIEGFISELKDIYTKYPCKVLATALWKIHNKLGKLQCSIVESYEDSKRLEAWDETGLHLFWNHKRLIDEATINRIQDSNFVIIHDDFFQKLNKEGFKTIKPYFRIKHDCKEVQGYSLNERFYISDVDPQSQLNEISELICRCYKEIHPSVETVRRWTESSVFDKNLWIWIMDRHTKKPVALGIADIDNSVPEGSLEWIQVLPEFQGNGLGKVLVSELLNRMSGKVCFVTVSGEVDNVTNPERLYRSCGFYGNDVWWLMRK